MSQSGRKLRPRPYDQERLEAQERMEELVLPDQPRVPAPREVPCRPKTRRTLSKKPRKRAARTKRNGKPTCKVPDCAKVASIGTGRTKIAKNIYDKVNWLNYSTATRTLLVAVFPKDTLWSHTLTGRLNPPFHSSNNLTLRLKKSSVDDIIVEVSRRYIVCPACVRKEIEKKCFEECLFKRSIEQHRIQMERRAKIRHLDVYHRVFG